MLPAIHFDYQPGLEAGKVGDLYADSNLTAEAVATELAPAQKAPQVALGVGCLASKLARIALGDGIAHWM